MQPLIFPTQLNGKHRKIRQTALTIPLTFGATLQWEVALKGLAIGSLLLLSVSAGFAQTAPLTTASPAMGATSPLGVPGTQSTVGAVGIPFGSTELSPGGLSPAPLDPTASTAGCSGTGNSGNGAIASGTSFDGGGINTSTVGTSAASACNSNDSASGTTASASSVSGVTASGAPGLPSVGAIPFGATELNNGGVSPMVFSPAPTSSCVTGLSDPGAASSNFAAALGTTGSTPMHCHPAAEVLT
jgi:hypothetical protein